MCNDGVRGLYIETAGNHGCWISLLYIELSFHYLIALYSLICSGIFNLRCTVDFLFFIGSQLVALSNQGRVGVWNAVSQHWQSQDVIPITSYDTAGSFLLLGGENGSIYYTGICLNWHQDEFLCMQKYFTFTSLK